jgi:hypothetical protein
MGRMKDEKENLPDSSFSRRDKHRVAAFPLSLG